CGGEVECPGHKQTRWRHPGYTRISRREHLCEDRESSVRFWEASMIGVSRVGTMNPPLTPPRSGTLVSRALFCSPLGRVGGGLVLCNGSTVGKLVDDSQLAVLQARQHAGGGDEHGAPDPMALGRDWCRAQ